ncbi:MAG: hypothetical protein ASARMPRED_000556 [Alectoria sarmentosa]|nr:MAG: hypothetical protein ASARMPRED_000556 [Alectoria sarmentosa]
MARYSIQFPPKSAQNRKAANVCGHCRKKESSAQSAASKLKDGIIHLTIDQLEEAQRHGYTLTPEDVARVWKALIDQACEKDCGCAQTLRQHVRCDELKDFWTATKFELLGEVRLSQRQKINQKKNKAKNLEVKDDLPPAPLGKHHAEHRRYKRSKARAKQAKVATPTINTAQIPFPDQASTSTNSAAEVPLPNPAPPTGFGNLAFGGQRQAPLPGFQSMIPAALLANPAQTVVGIPITFVATLPSHRKPVQEAVPSPPLLTTSTLNISDADNNNNNNSLLNSTLAAVIPTYFTVIPSLPLDEPVLDRRYTLILVLHALGDLAVHAFDGQQQAQTWRALQHVAVDILGPSMVVESVLAFRKFAVWGIYKAVHLMVAVDDFRPRNYRLYWQGSLVGYVGFNTGAQGALGIGNGTANEVGTAVQEGNLSVSPNTLPVDRTTGLGDDDTAFSFHTNGHTIGEPNVYMTLFTGILKAAPYPKNARVNDFWVNSRAFNTYLSFQEREGPGPEGPFFRIPWPGDLYTYAPTPAERLNAKGPLIAQALSKQSRDESHGRSNSAQSSGQTV